MVTESRRLTRSARDLPAGVQRARQAGVPQFAKLAEAVHEFGAKQFVQLYGPGVHDKGTMVFDEWHPLWGVSRTTSMAHREVPMVVGQAEIDELTNAFGESAPNV